MGQKSGRVAGTVFFLVALALVFGAIGVGRKVNVDENVFVASAALLSRHFVLLYRDYHYNHMPTLVIVYALLFRTTGYILLAARSVSAISAAGTAAAIFYFAYDAAENLERRSRLWFAIFVGVFFLADPSFTRTAGRAWNHDFPMATSVLGFLAMRRGLNSSALIWISISGVLVGLAATARLTFATELLPFCLYPLIYPDLRSARRFALLGAFAAGGIIVTLPSDWIWAQSPINAYFGNFQYPAFNTLWHRSHGGLGSQAYTLTAKLWFYLFNYCVEMPGNGIVLVVFLILSWSALRTRQVFRDAWQCQLSILVLLALSQLAAGLVPSPTYFQYLYAATPFMVLAIAQCLARVGGLGKDPGLNWILFGCLALTVGFAVPEYRALPRLFWPPAWFPVQAHEIGQRIAAETDGPVLTLDPIYALEGGLDIYPALATGPFGIRVGDYLSREQRSQYHMWGTAEVLELFEKHPPGAVLISPGSDGDFEPLFIRLAKTHGYHEIEINQKNPSVQLWLRPSGGAKQDLSTN
jgi:hypothetical protein